MIVFSRIDERLVHGQVAVKWTKEVKANYIVIVDDYTATNQTMKNMFVNMAPYGAKIAVCTVLEAVELLKTPEITGEDYRVMVLAKTPNPFLQLLDGGVELKELNVGNMGKSAGRKKYLAYFFATEEEIADLKLLQNRGVEIFCQNITDVDRAKTLNKVLKIK